MIGYVGKQGSPRRTILFGDKVLAGGREGVEPLGAAVHGGSHGGGEERVSHQQAEHPVEPAGDYVVGVAILGGDESGSDVRG